MRVLNKECVWSNYSRTPESVDGIVIQDAAVHLVPDGPITPLDQADGLLRIGRVGFVEQGDVGVGGHRQEDAS